MRNLLFILAAFQIVQSGGAQASVLVLEFPDQRQIAAGADATAPSREFQMWRCQSRSPGQKISNSSSIAQMRDNPNAQCAPVTQGPVHYERMPQAALQAAQDWAMVINDNAAFGRIVKEIETGRQARVFPDWDIDSNYILVGIRVGNTEYKMYIPKVGDVRSHIQAMIEQRFNNFLLNNASFMHLPRVYWDATNRDAVQVVLDQPNTPPMAQNFFYQQAEQFAEMTEWAESQDRLNRECRENLAEFTHYHQALLDELSGDRTSEAMAFIRRYQGALTQPLSTPHPELSYRHTEGNQCAQRLRLLQQLIAQHGDDDMAVIRPLKAETVGSYAATRARIAPPASETAR